jgi:hypothetical protein
MKKLLIFSALSFVMASSAFANPKAEVATTSPDCIVDKNDPYDTGPMMLKGPFKGQCMNLALHRPVLLVSEDDSAITVANFYHANHFWLAKVPKQGVDQIIFQIASFKESIPLIKFDHTQLRFVMKSGVTIHLTTQETGSTIPDMDISDFTLVDQIMGVDPEYSYDPVKGLKSAYGNVMRLVGSDDRAEEEMVGADNASTVVRQFVLKMSDADKDSVLLNGIRLADQLGYNDIYKLFSENCTTVIFKVLDQSVTYEKHVRKFKIHFWNILDPIGGPSIRALDKRGIVDSEINTWNKELHID